MDDSLIAVIGEGTPRYLHSFFASWQLFAEPDFGVDVRGLGKGTDPVQRELGKRQFISARANREKTTKDLS